MLVPGSSPSAGASTTLILLADQAADAIGIAVFFRGFSTFAARPLMNIHDLHVAPATAGVAFAGACWRPSKRRRGKWAIEDCLGSPGEKSTRPKGVRHLDLIEGSLRLRPGAFSFSRNALSREAAHNVWLFPRLRASYLTLELLASGIMGQAQPSTAVIPSQRLHASSLWAR